MSPPQPIPRRAGHRMVRVVQVVVQVEQAEEPAGSNHGRLRRIVDGEVLDERAQQRERGADVAAAEHVVRHRNTGDSDRQHQDAGGGDDVAGDLPGVIRIGSSRTTCQNATGWVNDPMIMRPASVRISHQYRGAAGRGAGPRLGAHVERLRVLAGDGQPSGVMPDVRGTVVLVGKPEHQRWRRHCVVQPAVPCRVTVDRFVLQRAVPRGDETEADDKDRCRDLLVAETAQARRRRHRRPRQPSAIRPAPALPPHLPREILAASVTPVAPSMAAGGPGKHARGAAFGDGQRRKRADVPQLW